MTEENQSPLDEYDVCMAHLETMNLEGTQELILPIIKSNIETQIETYQEITLPKLNDMKSRLDRLDIRIDKIQSKFAEIQESLHQDCLDITNGRTKEIINHFQDKVIFKMFNFGIIKLK